MNKISLCSTGVKIMVILGMTRSLYRIFMRRCEKK